MLSTYTLRDGNVFILRLRKTSFFNFLRFKLVSMNAFEGRLIYYMTVTLLILLFPET